MFWAAISIWMGLQMIWRKSLGSLVLNGSGADGDGDGAVDQDDYGVWRTHFGQTLFPVGLLLPGDYNGNQVIDSADYVVWRNALGNNVPRYSGADGDGNGVVDQADYNVWRAHFTQTLPPGGEGQIVAASATAPQIHFGISPAPDRQAGSAAPAAAIATGLTEATYSSAPAPGRPTRPQQGAAETRPKHDGNSRAQQFLKLTEEGGIRRRARLQRLVPREDAAAMFQHDDALVAWLNARDDEPENDELSEHYNLDELDCRADSVAIDEALEVLDSARLLKAYSVKREQA